jgi:hypothetical protein
VSLVAGPPPRDTETRSRASLKTRPYRDRCLTLGVVGSMTPKIYGNGYRIVQAPGYVVIMAEMIHEARVIPLDGRRHVGVGGQPIPEGGPPADSR